MIGKNGGLKTNYCKWCGKPTIMESMQLADTPILEFMEEKINKHGREKIWGENGDWSRLDLDSDFEAELLVYDEMLSTISKKTVCEQCIIEDDKMWKKYYGGDELDIIFDADF
jgi:hypothetical protein